MTALQTGVVCSCGQAFLPDDAFCRRCGSRRTPAAQQGYAGARPPARAATMSVGGNTFMLAPTSAPVMKQAMPPSTATQMPVVSTLRPMPANVAQAMMPPVPQAPQVQVNAMPTPMQSMVETRVKGLDPASTATQKLPVTVLTGCLGAGKTTLLNYILHEQRDKKVAVIENEVGEVSIDDMLVTQKTGHKPEQVIVLDNGCVCCTIRGDLVQSLKNILDSFLTGRYIDAVLLELTGMADPAPVVQTFFVDPDISTAFRLDAVVAMVDAKHAIQQLTNDMGKDSAAAQIAFSSNVLLNKVDLVTESEAVAVERHVRSLNKTAEVVRCVMGQVQLSKILNVGAFRLERVLAERGMEHQDFVDSFYSPVMDTSISNVGIRCKGAVCMHSFMRFLGRYLNRERGMDFLRTKGVLNIAGDDRKFVLQAVHMIRDENFVVPWGPGEERENRLVFIGRGMRGIREELNAGFRACIVQPLRFQVGQPVLVKIGPRPQDWEFARVIAHWDEMNPYRVLLDSGDEVWAPADNDEFIKSR